MPDRNSLSGIVAMFCNHFLVHGRRYVSFDGFHPAFEPDQAFDHGVPRPATLVEVPFAAYTIGTVEDFTAAAVPFDERGKGEGVAVVSLQIQFH